MSPLRLLIFDGTCRPGLSHAWVAAGWSYRAAGRFDAIRGAGGWKEALDWLARVQPGREIGEVQFWGHGKWGEALLSGESFDEAVVSPHHRFHDGLLRVRERMGGERALWWFRTCQTFGAMRGRSFAAAFGAFLGCRVAGHTFIIGPWQSGLHSIGPGENPLWPAEEGLARGSTPSRPGKALWSRPGRPNTITCLRSRLPSGF